MHDTKTTRKDASEKHTLGFQIPSETGFLVIRQGGVDKLLTSVRRCTYGRRLPSHFQRNSLVTTPTSAKISNLEVVTNSPDGFKPSKHDD